MFLDDLSIELIRNVLVVCAVIVLIITLKKLGFFHCKKCNMGNSIVSTTPQKSGFVEFGGFGGHTALAIRTVGRLDTEMDKIAKDGEQPKDDLLQKVYKEEPQESQAYNHFSKRNSRNPNYKTASNFLLRR